MAKKKKQIKNNQIGIISIIIFFAVLFIIIASLLPQDTNQEEEKVIEKITIPQEKISKEKLFEIVREITPSSSPKFKTLDGIRVLDIGKVQYFSSWKQAKIMYNYILYEQSFRYPMSWEIIDSSGTTIALKVLTYFPTKNTLARTTILDYGYTENEAWTCMTPEDIKKVINEVSFGTRCYTFRRG